MGRQSNAAARNLIAEQNEAIGQMNGALKRRRGKIAKKLTDARIGNVKFNYELGQDLVEVRDNPNGKFGEGRPLTLLERSLPQDKRTLRKFRQFAETISEEELDELLAITNEEANWTMHWGHVQLLLALTTHNQRKQYAERAARGLWDPGTLKDQITRRHGSATTQPHGRTHEMPATVHLQIRQMHQKTREWLTKNDQVWDGEQQSVITNILNEPPEELDQVDLDLLNELETMLADQVAAARSLKARVKEAKRFVNGVMQQRAKAEQDADAIAEQEGKEPRNIDLSGSNGTTTKKRRRSARPQPA